MSPKIASTLAGLILLLSLGGCRASGDWMAAALSLAAGSSPSSSGGGGGSSGGGGGW